MCREHFLGRPEGRAEMEERGFLQGRNWLTPPLPRGHSNCHLTTNDARVRADPSQWASASPRPRESSQGLGQIESRNSVVCVCMCHIVGLPPNLSSMVILRFFCVFFCFVLAFKYLHLEWCLSNNVHLTHLGAEMAAPAAEPKA